MKITHKYYSFLSRDQWTKHLVYKVAKSNGEFTYYLKGAH